MKQRFTQSIPLRVIITLLPFCAFAQEAIPAPSPAPAAELSQEEIILTEDGMEVITPEDVYPCPETSNLEVREHGEIPIMFRDDAMLDASHINQELGVNIYTAPSISKISDQLEGLPSIPDDYVLRKRPEHLPLEAGALAIEMGFLLSDGFIAVRSGRMNDIKPIALDLSRYGKAMGVGERMNMHSASLLEQAEKGLLEQFKKTLAATQSDVNAELIALKDPDLAHLIALGGWIRALSASCAALDANFKADAAQGVFYPDAPSYFSEILAGINPKTAEKIPRDEMRRLLNEISEAMILRKGESPSIEKVKLIFEKSKALSTLAAGKGYEH